MIWADTGRADLDTTVEYVSAESPTGAIHVFDALIAAAASLSEFAERGRAMPELGHDDVREIFVFSFRVIYQVTPDAVYVAGSRTAPAIFEIGVRFDQDNTNSSRPPCVQPRRTAIEFQHARTRRTPAATRSDTDSS